MSINLKIFIGSLVVFASCILTMIANYPKVYSPYSFSVVIPALLVGELGLSEFQMYIAAATPTVVLYLIWSIFFVNKSFIVSKPTIVLSAILIVLSVIFNVSSYQYGIKYQGILHTILMYAYNLGILATLLVVFKFNKANPSQNNCLGFNILLFSWLGWCAFPWLGELI